MFDGNYDAISAALTAIKETADDVDSVQVLVLQQLHDEDGSALPEVGMVLNYCNGNRGFVSRSLATHLLNDGILTRMRVPIDFV